MMAYGDYDILTGKPTKRERTLTAADKKRIAAKQGWKCKKCSMSLQARFHVDHIKPFAEGGSDLDSNLQALCSNCHDAKTEEERHRKQRKIREKEGRSEGGLLGGTGGLGIFGKNKGILIGSFEDSGAQKPKKHKKKREGYGLDDWLNR